jgi:anti-anti-sigma regulatory factor
MLNSEIKKSGKNILVVLKGDLNLENANEIKNTLVNALSKSKSIFIQLADIGAVDFSFLQLMCSTHRTAEMQNKTATFNLPIPEKIMKAARDFGFRKHIDCIPGKPVPCLWTTVEEYSQVE